MGLHSEEEECIRRASSTGSITVTDCPQSKDSESSTEETDGSACVSETTSFSMGGRYCDINIYINSTHYFIVKEETFCETAVLNIVKVSFSFRLFTV